MRAPQNGPLQFSRVLQLSAETRMRAIQEKISITFTFCTTVELEIRFANIRRAKYLLYKLHATVAGLMAHINDPAHVSDKSTRLRFLREVDELRRRVSQLKSLIEKSQSGQRETLPE